MGKPFKFKQFSIHQDRCAMKIGTDGVLLGAWTLLRNTPSTILDIGAGTGLISLMLAQRSDAEVIDAIEIDGDAYEQCVENFEASPWADRLFCYHAGLDEFTEEIDDKYDLIISNPPFYSEEVSSRNRARDLARQNLSLPFETLLQSSSYLLNANGVLSIIVPYNQEVNFVQLAATFNLYPTRITHVKGTSISPVKRSLIEFAFKKTEVSRNELTIELERHRYSDAYIELTKEFYLKM
ncbi:tRNA1(Val) (adenine(37)-N6)-methyltransferase [Spongiimicrobium sp. 3-5]|uniref:tRNA1(Val) (adenine(37)-N6)-methyltransferase n=1 Tax=Spongiimicrobium sp. 3-5 TaxID=3332596 RepID=UPI00397EAEFF